jgi:hypothetical protein
MAGYASNLMQPAFTKRFKSLSKAKLDDILRSFAFKNCRPHPELMVPVTCDVSELDVSKKSC